MSGKLTTEELLAHLIKKYVPQHFAEAVVQTVDEEELIFTAKCDDGSPILLGRLGAFSGAFGAGFAVVPSVGSRVQVVYTDAHRQEAYLLKASAVDKVLVQVAEQVVFNGGENGGLVIWPQLKAELERTHALLNALLSVINLVPGIPEPGNGAPSAFQAALKAAISTQSLGTFNQLENESIKH